MPESGTDITGIFDTLICDPGENRFIICVFYSQNYSKDDSLKKYYYRIILRYNGENKSDSKHSRVDSGIFWDDKMISSQGTINTKNNLYRTTRSGYSGRLAINFGIDFNEAGDYEVDLYVKEMDNTDSFRDLDNVSVKELQFVTLSPFKVIFKSTLNQVDY